METDGDGAGTQGTKNFLRGSWSRENHEGAPSKDSDSPTGRNKGME